MAWALVRRAVVDGVTYDVGDHVYLESANEAYYIGRVMEFRVRSDAPELAAAGGAAAFVPQLHSSPAAVAHPSEAYSSMEKRQQEGRETFLVKVAWFYRAKDVPKYHWRKGKSSSSLDPHLLLATMHTDVNPLVSLRGHCAVKYILEIDNLESYRAGEDNFYYWLLYDRFTFTIYDVVPTVEVKHLPAHVRAAVAPFKYILCESGRSTDFSEVSRVCKVCTGWIGSNAAESATCYTCMTHFHLGCLDADLRKRPGRGYVWNCRDCAEKLAQEDARRRAQNSTLGLGSAPPAASAAADAAAFEDDRDEAPQGVLAVHASIEVREPSDAVKELAKDWPFRYLGLYWQDKAQDTSLADDELIFPYARSRLGRAYQIDVPDEGGVDSAGKPRSRSIRVFDPEVPEQTVWMPPGAGEASASSSEDVSRYLQTALGKLAALIETWQKALANGAGQLAMTKGKKDAAKARRPSSTEETVDVDGTETASEQTPIASAPAARDGLVQTALHALSLAGHDSQRALQLLDAASHAQEGLMPGTGALREADPVRAIAADLADCRGHACWSADERQTFMRGIETCGRDPAQISHLLPSKTRQQVVSFFYYWKTTNEYRQWKAERKQAADAASEGEDEDEGQEAAGEAAAITGRKRKAASAAASKKHTLGCRHCGIRFDVEREGGRKVGPMREHLCGDCLRYWKKYGDMRPVADDELQRNGWTEEVGALASQGTPLEAPKKKKKVVKLHDTRPVHICAVCGDGEEAEDNHVVACAGCKMLVHQGCYGLAPEVASDTWTCAKCENDRSHEYTTNYKCMLCPASGGAMKRTFENNWVHVICAMFHNETRFADVERFEPVTCIGKVPRNRWLATCILCNQQTGACLVCSDRSCSKGFHVTCAQQQGLVMAPTFERGKGKQPKLLAFCQRHAPDRLPMYEEPRSSLLRNFCKAFKRQGAAGGALLRTQTMTLYDTCWCHMGGGPAKPPHQAHAGQATFARTSRGQASVAQASSSSSQQQQQQSSSQPQTGGPAADASEADGEPGPAGSAADVDTAAANNARLLLALSDGLPGSETDTPAAPARPRGPTCSSCGSDYTPFWWPAEAGDAVLCQACHWDAENPSDESDDEGEAAEGGPSAPVPMDATTAPAHV